jgi:hypothetical protein
LFTRVVHHEKVKIVEDDGVPKELAIKRCDRGDKECNRNRFLKRCFGHVNFKQKAPPFNWRGFAILDLTVKG